MSSGEAQFESFEAMFEHVCERFQISGNNDLDSNDIAFEMPDGLRIARWHVFDRDGKVVIVPSADQRPTLAWRAGNWVGERVGSVVDRLDAKYGDTNAVDRMLLVSTFIALVGATLSVIYIVMGARR